MAHDYDNDKCCPTTSGGNTTIVNGDEQEPLDRCVMIPVRTEGGQDQDFH